MGSPVTSSLGPIRMILKGSLLACQRTSTSGYTRYAPAPMKLYLARFSPATTDSRRKLYLESFAMRRYATHGVKRSPGNSTYTGTQLPRFSLRMMFSTVESGGNAGSFCVRAMASSMPHSNHNRVRIDLGVYRHVVEEGGRRPRWSEGVDALWQGGKSRDAGSENTRLYRSHLGARRQAQSPSRPRFRPLLTENSTHHTPAVLRPLSAGHSPLRQGRSMPACLRRAC